MIKQREQLKKSYPNISWNQLKKQNNEYETDDGCIHYINTLTTQIYSWDTCDEEWMQHDANYQQSLMDLFD